MFVLLTHIGMQILRLPHWILSEVLHVENLIFYMELCGVILKSDIKMKKSEGAYFNYIT